MYLLNIRVENGKTNLMSIKKFKNNLLDFEEPCFLLQKLNFALNEIILEVKFQTLQIIVV